MSKRTLLPDEVEQYVFQLMEGGDLEQRLRHETAALPNGNMQIGPDQAAFMAMLARLMGARRALEIGTFTGYSALAVASALPEDGQLVCCDVSDEWTSVGRRYWKEAGLQRRIELRLGPALQTLEGLLRERGAGSFDLVFIDADKPNYEAYYEACLKLVRQGGLILLDNVLWHGEVADPASDSKDAVMFRALNRKLRNDKRVETCLLPIGDGVMMARKLES